MMLKGVESWTGSTTSVLGFVGVRKLIILRDSRAAFTGSGDGLIHGDKFDIAQGILGAPDLHMAS